jgi:hypothetical protein
MYILPTDWLSVCFGAGTFSNTSAATACLPCLTGRFADGYASSQCQMCRSGSSTAFVAHGRR